MPLSNTPRTRVRACFLSLFSTLALAGCEVHYGDLGEYSVSESGAAGTAAPGGSGGGSTTSGGPDEALTTGDEPPACEFGVDPDCLELQPGFEELLAFDGGCSDLVLHASEVPAGAINLHVEVEGLLAAAQQAGAAQVTSFALPHPEVAAEVWTGDSLNFVVCNEPVENPDVAFVYVPIAGELTITVTPFTEDDPDHGRATAVFEGVVWRRADDPDAAPVAMGEFTIEDAKVGFTPG